MKYGDACGEIDLAEFRTYAPDRALPTLHYEDDGTAGPKTTWDCLVNRPEDFHIHALEWTTTTMTFAYDGIVCFSHTWKPAQLKAPAPFDEPYFMILNQSIASSYGFNKFDPAITPLPSSMEIDYVKAWSWSAAKARRDWRFTGVLSAVQVFH